MLLLCQTRDNNSKSRGNTLSHKQAQLNIYHAQIRLPDIGYASKGCLSVTEPNILHLTLRVLHNL